MLDESDKNSRSATYVRVVVFEAAILVVLWLIGRTFT